MKCSPTGTCIIFSWDMAAIWSYLNLRALTAILHCPIRKNGFSLHWMTLLAPCDLTCTLWPYLHQDSWRKKLLWATSSNTWIGKDLLCPIIWDCFKNLRIVPVYDLIMPEIGIHVLFIEEYILCHYLEVYGQHFILPTLRFLKMYPRMILFF